MSAHQSRPPLNGKGLVVNIADDMCLRLQNDLTPLNRTLNIPINNDAFGCNNSVNMRPAGDQGRSRKPSPSLCLPGGALAPNSHQQSTRAHLSAEGSANDRCHHRVQNLAPLSQNRKESKDSGQYQA